VHYKLVNAFSVFDSWPRIFHVFLDQLRLLNRSSKRHATLQGDFGGFYRQLYTSRSLSQSTVVMLRKEFQQYVSERWDDGYLGMAKWFRSGNYRDKYITRGKACRMLRIDHRTLDRLVSEGKLRAIVRRRSGTRLYLVQATSLEQMRLYRALHLTLNDTTRFLGIGRPLILRLVESSLLSPARGVSIYKYKYNPPYLRRGLLKIFFLVCLPKQPSALDFVILNFRALAVC
jgi:hypothetical protein